MLIKAIIVIALLILAAGALWMRKRKKEMRKVAAHTRWREKIHSDWDKVRHRP
jgi:LPXTG-motif cell wall-anchored protein